MPGVLPLKLLMPRKDLIALLASRVSREYVKRTFHTASGSASRPAGEVTSKEKDHGMNFMAIMINRV